MSCNLTPNSLALNGKLDRNQFIRSFIESQRTHLSSYASEGQTAQRALMTKTPTLIAENPELPSIFGSPVLKPRVPENNQRTTEVTQPAGKIKPKEAVEAGKMKKSTSREKDSKRTNDLARLGEKQSTKQVTLDRFVKPEVRRSRKRRESSDSEHEARKQHSTSHSRLVST